MMFHQTRTRHHCRIDSSCQQQVLLVYAMDFCPWLRLKGYEHHRYMVFHPTIMRHFRRIWTLAMKLSPPPSTCRSQTSVRDALMNEHATLRSRP
ncbi:hypothetical protein K439DRAFT_1047426 [Ramaria rubella]|nr:hypothetical protein K439DRAFT_1047426 [Ramaria rubella]